MNQTGPALFTNSSAIITHTDGINRDLNLVGIAALSALSAKPGIQISAFQES
jgi:hypothetical protein